MLELRSAPLPQEYVDIAGQFNVRFIENRGVCPNTGAVSFIVGFSGVHFIPLGEDGRKVIAIDSGPDVEAKVMRDLLDEMGRDLTDIEALYLTHGHFDHYLGAAALDNRASIFASGIDAAAMKSQPENPGIMPEVMQQEESHTHGDIEVRALSTPGHTAGSMTYLVSSAVGEALFTGDVFDVSVSGEVQLPPAFSTQDMEKARETILSLGSFVADRPGVILHPGHSAAIPGEEYTAATSSWA